MQYRPISEDQWDVPAQDGELSVPDVQPGSFSIQDAKLKAEEENAKAAAERQKKRVRERVRELRKELEELQHKNGQLPMGGLSVAETTVDPEYVRHLMHEMENKVN